MTNGQHMMWMLDEYETITGQRLPGMITGKPVGLGGSLGRTEATGYGVIYTLRECLKNMNLPIENTAASIQGFGNVAEYAARLYVQLGGKLVAVSGSKCTFRKLSGCDPEELAGCKNAHGSIDPEKAAALGYEILPGDEWLSQDVDILIPAALENQITPAVFPNISKQVKILCEAANGPTTPDCDQLIQDAGIMLIPDFMCNAGGVTCSYFEQVQGNMNYYWPKEEVLEKLEAAMTKAFQNIYDLAQEKKLYMRDAAYVVAINRVVNAVKTRGWV